MVETKEVENGPGEVYVDRKNAEASHIPIDEKELARIYRKIDLRILPLQGVLFILCYLDRSNIGNAKVLNVDTGDDMMHELNMTEYQYRIAMMVFLVSYSFFEAPSNMLMKILNPPLLLGALGITFGSLCAAIGGSQNTATVTALRFLLGMAEAGVYPGIIFHLSFWYGPNVRGLRIAVMICCMALSGAFGGLIAYGVSHINGAEGISAWRWLFIVEGLPCIAVGVAIMFFLPCYPENAKWLTAREKDILTSHLGDTASKGQVYQRLPTALPPLLFFSTLVLTLTSNEKLNWDHAKATLKEARLYFHYLSYFCNGITASSLSLFAPSIINGIGYTGVSAQLFLLPPYTCAFFMALFSAYLSDKYQIRGLVVAGGCVVGLATFLVQIGLSSPSLHLRYAMLVLSTCSMFAVLPVAGAWISDNVHTTTASALATGLNITFAGPGQIVGVWIYKDSQAPRYQLGHGVNAGALALSGLVSFSLWFYYSRSNKTLPSGARKWIA